MDEHETTTIEMRVHATSAAVGRPVRMVDVRTSRHLTVTRTVETNMRSRTLYKLQPSSSVVVLLLDGYAPCYS